MLYEKLTGGAKQAYDAMIVAMERAAVEDGMTLTNMVMRDVIATDLGFTNNAFVKSLTGLTDNDYNAYFSQVLPDNTYLGIYGVCVKDTNVTGAATKESTVLKL